MIRKAKAVWHGTGRAGSGQLTSDLGVLDATPYSFKTRFENEKGTNPEELIAAAHAGCFTMALAFGLQARGLNPTELSTEAAVTLDPDGQGFQDQQICSHLAGQGAEPRRRRLCPYCRRSREELSGLEGAQRRDHARREADVGRAFIVSPSGSGSFGFHERNWIGQMPGFRLGRQKHRMRRMQNGRTDQLGVEI